MYRLIATLLLAGLTAAPTAARAEMSFFTLGAGELNGSYFATARAICQEVNRTGDGRLRCSPETTPGSIYNLFALRRGDLDLGIAQADWLQHAEQGTAAFSAEGPDATLEALAPLYVEAVTILARRDAETTSFGDLLGKHIDLGHPASGRRATADFLLSVLGHDTTDFASVGEFRTGAAIEELCAGTLDATILTLGHPSALIEEALVRCDLTLVGLDDAATDTLLKASSAYIRTLIPSDTYPGRQANVLTVGVVATLVSSPETSTAVRGSVLKAVSRIKERQPVGIPLLMAK